MPLIKGYMPLNFLRKQNYKQTTSLPARANATYEISVVSYTFIKKWRNYFLEVNKYKFYCMQYEKA